MRNKWFVVGSLLPAAALTYGAVRGAMSDNGLLFAVLPALLAAALVAGAVWVAKAESFSPAPKTNWDYGTSEAVTRWTKHREDSAATAAMTPTNQTDSRIPRTITAPSTKR